MNLKIGKLIEMNILQHYPQKEKSARTLIWITPCKAIAAALGRENRHHPQNSVGVQHLSFMCIFPAPLTTNLLYYLFRPPAAHNVLNLKVFTAAGVHLFLKKEKEFCFRTATPFFLLPSPYLSLTIYHSFPPPLIPPPAGEISPLTINH